MNAECCLGNSDDGKRQAPSVYTVLMKRLSTEGVTDEMLNHCTTRFNLMTFIKHEKYMLNLVSQSRCLNSFNNVGTPTGGGSIALI